MNTHDIGKLLFAGFEGTFFAEDSHPAKLIRNHHVHFFLLQPRNYVNINQLKNLINDIQSFAYTLNYNTPLIIACDTKLYRHLCDNNCISVTRFPTSLAMAAAGKISTIFQIGKAVAIELRNIGFNMFFGPILNISPKLRLHSDDSNTFGVSIDEVIKYGGAFACGLKSGGILTCAINFPGTGKTTLDPVSGCPVLLDDLEQIKTVSSQPFKKIMEHGVIDSIRASIISASNALPKDDANICLSPKIIDGLLRNELKFDNMVISECLEVENVILTYGIGQAACMAILHAHCDIVSVCYSFEYQVEALEYLSKAFENGSYQAILVTALRRVDGFLNRVSWLDPKVEVNNELSMSHRNLSTMAYSESITIVRNNYNIIPITKFFKNTDTTSNYIPLLDNNDDIFKENRILLLAPKMDCDFKTLSDGLEYHGKQYKCIVDLIEYTPEGITPHIKKSIEKSTIIICICSDLFTNIYQVEMIRSLSSASNIYGDKLITVTVDSPYYFNNDMNIPGTLICTYDSSFDALRFLPAIVFGRTDTVGKTPGYNKLDSRQQVMMGLSNYAQSGENFDLLLNKPQILNTSATPPQSGANSDFDQNYYNNNNNITDGDGFLEPPSSTQNFMPMDKEESDPSMNNEFDQAYTSDQNGSISSIMHSNETRGNKDNINSTFENFNSHNVLKEKPWVVEDFQFERDITALTMIRLNTITDIYQPIDKDMLCRLFSFSKENEESQKLFIVRNSTLGTIYGIVVTFYDEFEKCGKVVHIVVAKNKRRQGVGEVLHRRAVQYLTIERGGTTVALGCSFPFFNYLTPKLLNEISSIWYYLETKDNSKIDIKDKSLQLVGFYRSLGWCITRHKKGVYQQERKYLMYLQFNNWSFPGEKVALPSLGIESAYYFMGILTNMNIRYVISDDAGPAFDVCKYLLKAKLCLDDEEVSFSKMYSETKRIIENEIDASLNQNKKRNTMIVYAVIDNVVCGACIVYNSNSRLSNFYPLIDGLKRDALDIVAGLTGLFVGKISGESDETGNILGPPIDLFSEQDKQLIRLGLISTCVKIIENLGIKSTLIHNVSQEELKMLETCGFEKYIEYCTCFGKKRAFEWVI